MFLNTSHRCFILSVPQIRGRSQPPACDQRACASACTSPLQLRACHLPSGTLKYFANAYRPNAANATAIRTNVIIRHLVFANTVRPAYRLGFAVQAKSARFSRSQVPPHRQHCAEHSRSNRGTCDETLQPFVLDHSSSASKSSTPAITAANAGFEPLASSRRSRRRAIRASRDLSLP